MSDIFIFLGYYDAESSLIKILKMPKRNKYPKFEMNEDGRFPCPRCNATSYKQRSHVYRHLKYECGVAPMFDCGFCGKKFKQNVHLKSHLKFLHGVV